MLELAGLLTKGGRIPAIMASAASILQATKPPDNFSALEVYTVACRAELLSGPSDTLYASAAVAAGGAETKLNVAGVGATGIRRFVPFVDLVYGENKLAGVPGNIVSIEIIAGAVSAGDDGGLHENSLWKSGVITIQPHAITGWIRVFPWLNNSGDSAYVPIKGGTIDSQAHRIQAKVTGAEGRISLIVPGSDYAPYQAFKKKVRAALI